VAGQEVGLVGMAWWLGAGKFDLGLVEILALGIETAQVFFSHFPSL
jgi:hypothetical protein